jgi:hypothetical protein
LLDLLFRFDGFVHVRLGIRAQDFGPVLGELLSPAIVTNTAKRMPVAVFLPPAKFAAAAGTRSGFIQAHRNASLSG